MAAGREIIWLHKDRCRRRLYSGKVNAGGHVDRAFESEMDMTMNGKRRRVQHCGSPLLKGYEPSENRSGRTTKIRKRRTNAQTGRSRRPHPDPHEP
ncbi:hypothetical protein BGZ90_007245, partial [Linnemannia elongata]